MDSVVTSSCCDRKRKISAISNSSENCYQLQQCSDWSKIDSDLLEYIQKKLTLAEILRCWAVCRSWRSITKTHLSSNYPPTPSAPLILSRPQNFGREADEKSDKEAYWYLLDVLSSSAGGGNLYLLNQKFKQLLAAEEMDDCVGYSHGYFLFSDREGEETLYLFHPRLFSGSVLRFPIRCIYDYAIKKATLWGADPISGSYGIALILEDSKNLLFAKHGSTHFTPLEGPLEGEEDTIEDCFEDILCVNNLIYGITYITYDHENRRFKSCIKAWDCSCTGEDRDGPKKVLDFEPKFSPRYPSRGYLRLVESQGDILLVAIHTPEPRCIKKTGGLNEYNKVDPLCQVYKMDFNKKEWVLINSLADCVLLIMEFQSISLSSREFPQYQRNSIYFRHYLITPRGHPRYLGIFNMEDGSVKVIELKRKC